ncbi:anaphase-promoting complex subunit 10 [Pyrenophora tritici-repentis]|nr:anaphase-promoting complex subunit 10 [Pyrenophora tritici-repentis]KAI0610135.1 anaphase-promoting complex subunit 10 [Pyrenophora tritici-repentis]KAI0622060.1 anaphase-promoting complex subunit 10 [Pyrenophora tritici-repentis]
MSPPTAEEDSDSETELGRQDGDDDVGDGEALGEEEEEELDDDEGLASPNHNDNPQPNIDPPPSYLREVSTLASWTVSSSKPGCSIPQLRHPSTNLFWQSDGPQPHYLNIHFFKLVRIVGLRLYLDFEQDESYTPTKIIFLAGSGMNDLQEWAPTNTNGRQRGANEAASSDSENAAPQDTEIETPVQNQHHTPMPAYDPHQTPQTQHTHDLRHRPHQQMTTPSLHATSTPAMPRPQPRQPSTSLSPNPAPRSPPSTRQRPPKMPVLRAHLVQVKILENHQNGKDTHLRGLQIFARNDEDLGRSGQEHGMRGDMKAVTGVSTPSVHLATGKEAVVRKLKEERLELGRSAWDMEGCIR